MKCAATLLVLAAVCLAAPVAMAQNPTCAPGDFAIVTDCTNLPVAVSGQSYTAQIVSAGCDIMDLGGGGIGGWGGGCAVYWNATGLPDGLVINTFGESTVITGVTSLTGDYEVTITATDQNANGGFAPCDVTCTGTITVTPDLNTVPPQYQTLGNTPANYLVVGSPNDDDDHANDCMISAASPAGAFAALGAALLAASLAFLRRK